jgi:hypothetical protein
LTYKDMVRWEVQGETRVVNQTKVYSDGCGS